MSEQVKIVVYRDNCKGLEKDSLWAELGSLLTCEAEEILNFDNDEIMWIERRGGGSSVEDILKGLLKEFKERNPKTKVHFDVFYIEQYEPDESIAM